MLHPFTMTFRDVPRSASLEAHVRDLALRLHRIDGQISRCHVTLLGTALGDRFDATAYAANIELSVPGAEIHADSLLGDGTGHDSLYHALRNAYENASRQLRELSQSRLKSI